ncbi:MAG: chloride channel protein [Bacteroidales bacterium]|nr:chloride channel protein [Bacteroidales bacterium]MCL2133837.1 chloride channel protein [Bacteroidales bacterium]
MSKLLTFIQNGFLWLKRLPYRQLIVVLAFATGLLSGLAAVLLKHAVHLVQWVLTGWFNTTADSLLYLLYPGIGMLIALLYVRYVVKDDISHGVTKVLHAISRKDSKIKRHNCYSSIAASSVTIGMGGSVGAEAPIVYTGAALGSNLAQFFKLDYRSITLLLGCGAAGAVAGIFKAPLAGIVFTLEILMLDLSLSSILPLLVSSVTATSVSYFMLGNTVSFSTALVPFNIGNLPYYLALGIFCGFGALYFTRATLAVEQRIKRILNPFRRWFLCALGLGLLIFIFPPLYGEGYGALSALLNGDCMAAAGTTLYGGFSENVWFILLFFIAVFFFKILSMSFTNAGGGVGGTFGPTLFMGGIVGFLVARLINVSGIHTVPEANFAMVGMAGMMSAVMTAPLTAIFLIAEITGGYGLLMPLMLVSATSFFTIRGFEKHSIYTKRLALSGDLITHDKDKAVLTIMQLDALVEKDFISVTPDTSLGELVKVISLSHRNLFPVLNHGGALVGVVALDDVRKVMFDTQRYDTTTVDSLMKMPKAFVHSGDNMQSVLDKFESAGVWNLPVIDEKGLYIGFVSKSKIFSSYRNLLQQFSDE